MRDSRMARHARCIRTTASAPLISGVRASSYSLSSCSRRRAATAAPAFLTSSLHLASTRHHATIGPARFARCASLRIALHLASDVPAACHGTPPAARNLHASLRRLSHPSNRCFGVSILPILAPLTTAPRFATRAASSAAPTSSATAPFTADPSFSVDSLAARAMSAPI